MKIPILIFFLLLANAFKEIRDVASACSNGYYPASSTVCDPCPMGHYCPTSNNQAPIPCPIGTVSYSTISSRTSCYICSAGYYNDEVGQYDCKMCPSGHFCPSSSKKVKCPPGKISYSTQSERTRCVSCSSGYYNEEVGQSICKMCPDGHFCPTGDVVLPCPVGTVSYSTTSERTKCSKCGSGYYTDQEGQSTCRVCPEGHFCPNPDSSPIVCPAGTVSRTQIIDRTTCAKCSPGYYIDVSGEIYCKACPVGHYCPTSDSSPLPCPPGKFSYSLTIDRTSCATCSNGYYNEKSGQSACKQCPPGFYCQNKTECPVKCPPNTFSSNGSVSLTNCFNSTLSGNQLNCQQESISNEPIKCEPGYFSTATSCNLCPLGHFCPTNSSPKQRIDGYVTSSPMRCLEGTVNHNSVYHRVSCRLCPLGTYNNKQGGIFDGVNSDCQACLLGHYCASTREMPIECPAGTVNFANERHRNHCQKCPLGSYNARPGGINDGQHSDCKTCPPGYYCPSIKKCPIKCPEESKSIESGSWSVHNCLACTNCSIDTIQCENPTQILRCSSDAALPTNQGMHHGESTECVGGVKYFCLMPASMPSFTNNAIKGDRVLDNCDTLESYTAIATFDSTGHYKGHAAIFVSCDSEKNTITVYDQWNTQTWHKRDIWNVNSNIVSNNPFLFHVVELKAQ